MNIKNYFKFFRENNVVYLDNAATTQVPDKVLKAVNQVLEQRGNPSRASHDLATKAEEKIDLARDNIARFLNASPDEIVFSNNTTDSVNLAVDSVLHHFKKGDELIVSEAEHHSNLIPYEKLVKKGVKIRVVSVGEKGVSEKDVEKILTKKTKMVALQHASNVLGHVNPVEKIGDSIKKFNKDIIYLVDGASAISHVPADVKKMKCDFYAFSGHKVYGPDGVGVLYVNKRLHSLVQKVRSGGGTINDAHLVRGKKDDSLVVDHKIGLIGLEGGTPNTANIIGLSEAINFVRSISYKEITKKEKILLVKLRNELKEIDEIIIHETKDTSKKIGILSFSLKDMDLTELGNHLNKRKIYIRYGSHCAFPLTETLGTETIRISLGIYNEEEDIDKIVQEIQFFIDKKKGRIKNPNLERYRDFVYYKNNATVQSFNEINRIFSVISEPDEAEVMIMAGHFLAIPDVKSNSFYPSIKPLLPKHLHNLLDEFGMTTFPLFTWELGCKLLYVLKKRQIKAKLFIIANDTTGLNELKESKVNKENKTAKQYREEFLNRFGDKTLPKPYLEIMNKHGLSMKDVLTFEDNQYYVKESSLRGRFNTFIEKNKQFFDGMINYSTNKYGNLDISMNILDNAQIKTCNFNTFNSKTGGKFCIAELTQLCAELFGQSKEVQYKYVSTNVKKHKIKAKENMLVMLTPEMCDGAVSRAAELYNKVFLQEKYHNKFKFFNIPFGPEAERSLAIGSNFTYVSDKDSLAELEVPTTPEFIELWKLNEYSLLYDVEEHVAEVEELFEKQGITKKSKILDTCVGPGFMTVEMLEKGYNFLTNDRDDNNIKPFLESLNKKGIKPKHTSLEWLDLKKEYEDNSLDFIFNKGNTFIYADGGFQRKIPVDKKRSLSAFKKTLKIYYDLLKKGGYLYIDKYKDSEIPAEKVAARIKVLDTKEKKDILFTVKRKPEQGYRFASMALRDKKGKKEEYKFMAYDLTEGELEELLENTGFEFKKIPMKTEKHFVVWLARKPKK